MTEDPVNIEQDKALFAHLVMMFSTSVLQHLGQIPNPATQERNVDLEGAQATIDMLDMLDHKTAGNRDEEEDRLLQESLSSLKMSFVQAQSAAGAPPPAEEPEPATAEEPTVSSSEDQPAAPAEPVVGTPGETGETKEPKFHKKYD